MLSHFKPTFQLNEVSDTIEEWYKKCVMQGGLFLNATLPLSYYRPYHLLGMDVRFQEDVIPCLDWLANVVYLRREGPQEAILHARLHEFGHVLQYDLDVNAFMHNVFLPDTNKYLRQEVSASIFAALMCKEFGHDPSAHIAHVNRCLHGWQVPFDAIPMMYIEAVILQEHCLTKMGSLAKELMVAP